MTSIYSVLEEVFPEEDFTLRELAEKAYSTLQERHPELLGEWQRRLTISALISHAAGIQHHRRAAARTVDIQTQVEKMAETGESIFSEQSYPLKDNVWKPLGLMTGPDHKFVAERYLVNSKQEALLGQFHKQVAKRVGSKTTAEAFTEEQYLSMLQSIVLPVASKPLTTAQVA